MFHLRSFSKLYDYDMCSLNMEKAMAPPLQYSCLANPMDGRILEGCSPWGPEELDMAKRLHFHFSLSDQLCDPMDYTAHGILQARILEWVNFPFSRGSFQPRNQTQVSRIAGRFFTRKPQGKPKNTGMGSLSLLQGIFPTQELNQGLLHCRRILCQLRYQGNPFNI